MGKVRSKAEVGSIAGEGRIQAVGAEIAIQQAEVIGRVGDGRVTPVDDASDGAGHGIDEYVFDAQIVVRKHQVEAVVWCWGARKASMGPRCTGGTWATILGKAAAA